MGGRKSGRRGPAPPKAGGGKRAAPTPAPALRLSSPAWLAAIATAVVCVVAALAFRLYDTDLWQLLVVGKAIWAQHRIPDADWWTWRQWGQSEVVSSWLFRALLWPVWSAAGVWGLYLWRWALALTALALLWATARRLGARGFVALVAILWWALLFRSRTHVRPEALVAVLFALTLWILETRRQGGPDRRAWLVPIAWAWANVHATYYLGFVLQGLYLLDAALVRHRQPALAGAHRRWPPHPIPILGACMAVSFLHPFGWRALWQPFEFALRWRADPMFQTIGELQPLPLEFHLHNPLLFLPWLALLAWRNWRRPVDWVEIGAFAVFAAMAHSSVRFLGFYALAAAAFFARDLQELVESLRWPAWTRRPAARTALASAACAIACGTELARNYPPLGIAIDPLSVPERAADFLEAQGVRGRAFNHFHLGGYLAYRFWPDRDRLPFVSTQPELTAPADRALYARARGDIEGWRALDGRYRFDYAVLAREQQPGEQIHDFLDRDPEWALVFADDAGLVYLRRTGSAGARAESLAYRASPAGRAGREMLMNEASANPGLRQAAMRDLERQIGASPHHALAKVHLGVLTLMDERVLEGERLLREALAMRSDLPNAHWYLGLAALRKGLAREAIAHFEAEKRLGRTPPGLELRLGQALARIDDRRGAARAYRRELERYPENDAARQALAELEERSGP